MCVSAGLTGWACICLRLLGLAGSAQPTQEARLYVVRLDEHLFK